LGVFAICKPGEAAVLELEAKKKDGSFADPYGKFTALDVCSAVASRPVTDVSEQMRHNINGECP
jgi:hypothetical protein